MDIKQYQKQVDDWINTYGVRYFDVKTNTLLLTEEIGEFARLIARQHGEQSFKNPVSEIEVKEQISDEMADILFVIGCLANQMDIDLETAIKKNFSKKTTRDQDRHINNPKLS